VDEVIEPIPIYAQGYFHVHRSGLIDQIIIYDYWDPGRVYESIIKDKKKLSEEINKLASNMQMFLDMEKVIINDKETHPVVVDVDIGLRGRPELAFIVFHIVFYGSLTPGVNKYVNIYEEEVVEYDYDVYWFFPEKTRVLKADLGVPHRVSGDGRVLFFHVEKGTRINGRETIIFKIES